jgi:uncharacterized protein (TIGR00162 family)
LESSVRVDKKVELKDAILIEGLPGIGLVANISAIHLIDSLKAEKFGEISSPHFQDLVISTEVSDIKSPVHELYYSRASSGGHDVIILYGNTQALTVYGQYELCGRILSLTQDLNCKLIVCIGGIKKDKIHDPPHLYCTATDFETLREIRNHGLEIFQGQIYGVVGLLLGLAKLRGIRGFSILVETLGMNLDVLAAKNVLVSLDNILDLGVNLEELEGSVTHVSNILKSYGLVETKRSKGFFGSV